MSRIGLMLAVAALLGAGAAALVMSMRDGKVAPATAVVKESGKKPSCCEGH
jgi:hypothetical protein